MDDKSRTIGRGGSARVRARTALHQAAGKSMRACAGFAFLLSGPWARSNCMHTLGLATTREALSCTMHMQPGHAKCVLWTLRTFRSGDAHNGARVQHTIPRAPQRWQSTSHSPSSVANPQLKGKPGITSTAKRTSSGRGVWSSAPLRYVRARE